MNNIINKVKDVVTGHQDNNDSTTHSAGPHGSDTANRVDPRVDSDNSRTYGNTGGMNTHGSTNAGPYDSNIANKLDPRVDSDRDGSNRTTGSGVHGYSTGYGTNTSNTAGPHNSDMANKLDPRVDSDRDGSHRTTGTGTTGYGHSDSSTGYGHNTSSTGYGQNTSSTGYGQNTSNTAGPHSSNLANKLDPRVDSDRDGSHRTTGNTGMGTSGYGHNDSSTGYGHNTSSTGYGQNTSNTAGPHSSNIANKLDPRVDSDRDGSHRTAGTTGMGTTGYGHSDSSTGYGQNTSTNYGPHDSNIANKLDPRIDSDRDGSRYGGNTGSHTHGSTGTGMGTGSHLTGGSNYGSSNVGPHDSNVANRLDPRVDHSSSANYGDYTTPRSHANTGTGSDDHSHGPHKSNLLNKLDPRVDSDRDNSNTVGNNNSSGTGPYAERDTYDAAQVPPSAFQREAGHHMSTGGSKSGNPF